MNGTIGRGAAVHSITGDYANCGKGAGKNAVTATQAPIDCRACIKLQKFAASPAPVVESYKVTYQVNSIGRGWVTKALIFKGTEAWVAARVADLMNTSGYRVLESRKI